MGIEAFFRKVCEELCPDAFYPQSKCEWPDTSDVSVMIDDVNSRIRAYPLCMSNDSELLPYGIKTWGEILHRLEAEYLKFFSQGIRVIVVVFDGKCPIAKEIEQNDRRRAWEEKMEREHIQPYQWPTTPGLESAEFRTARWFKDTDRPAMGFSDIYYNKPSKIQWINYLTEFITKRMVMPVNCRVIVDSGVLENLPMLNPIVAHTEWVGPPLSKDKDGFSNIDELCATEPEPGDEKKPELWSRTVEDVSDEPRYWTYTEADDRLIYWVYRFAHEGIVVCSEDGDTMLSLMATYRSRAEARLVNRLYLRRMDRRGMLADRTPIKQPQIMDINRLSDCIQTFFGGLIGKGLERSLHELPESFEVDGVLLFSLLVLMRPNDYSEGFTGVGPLNLFRAAIVRSDLCAKMFVCETHDRDKEGADKFAVPTTVMIQFEPFKKFVEAAYKQGYMLRERADGHKRPDIYEKRFPIPDDSTVAARAARIAWTLNKLCNGGRPQYKIPFELKRERVTDLPVFGYSLEEDQEASKQSGGAPPGAKKVKRSTEVPKRTYYGERHVGLTSVPDGGFGMQDTVREQEARVEEQRRAEREEKEREEKEDRAREKRREAYATKKYINQALSSDQDVSRGGRGGGGGGYRGRGNGYRGRGGPSRGNRDVYIPDRRNDFEPIRDHRNGF